VQKAAVGAGAEPLSVDVVGQGQLAASALLRLPSAALAARLKERLGSKLLSPRENVVFFPDRLKHGKKFCLIMYRRDPEQDQNVCFFKIKPNVSDRGLHWFGLPRSNSGRHGIGKN
jgi:hypothetical protein